MADYASSVETIIEDLNDLESEIMRELSGEGWTNVMPVMEQNGYINQINTIRERVNKLLKMLQNHLGKLRNFDREYRDDEDASKSFESKIEEVLGLVSQLLAVWERLQSLVSLIELKQNASGQVNQAVASLKTWLSTLASWIKRISVQLWNLLSKLLTPKEWKLGGKVGTGPFGLADVTVEVTFGP